MNHSTETPTKPGYYAWASSKTDGWKLAKMYLDASKTRLLFDSTFNPYYNGPVPLGVFTRNFKHGELKWRKLYTEEEAKQVVERADQCWLKGVGCGMDEKGKP